MFWKFLRLVKLIQMAFKHFICSDKLFSRSEWSCKQDIDTMAAE